VRAATAGGVALRGEASTAVFRVLLAALAEPGTVQVLPRAIGQLPVPPALVVPLALADQDCTVTIVGADPGGELARLLCTATSAWWAPLESAGFVVDLGADAGTPVACRRGSALEPERGARLAVAVEGFGGGTEVVLEGPGVPGRRRLRVRGVRPAWFRALAAANRNRPAGVDAWLLSPHGGVVGLPRSTRVTVAGDAELAGG
jgi:alpha-D-ribose 1-methylphosphonate 5-triphosphate synthase subunit PhnH